MKTEDLKAYEVDKDGWLCKAGRLCVPNVDGLMEEARGSSLEVNNSPDGNKMYRDTKWSFY